MKRPQLSPEIPVWTSFFIMRFRRNIIGRRCIFVGGLAVALGASPFLAEPVLSSTDERPTVRSLQQELQKLRRSLHEAHVELGVKADRIAELKAERENSPVSGEKKRDPQEGKKDGGESAREVALRRELADSRREVEELRGELERLRKASAAKVTATEGDLETDRKKLAARSGAKGTDPPPAPVEVDPVDLPSFQIRYERRSAVNYAGREKALQFVRKQLKTNPSVKFSIVGGADDTPYAVTNNEIARNRVEFLASYLRVNGVPGDCLAETPDRSFSKRRDSGRFVEIRVLGER